MVGVETMTAGPNLATVRVVSSVDQLRPLVDRHDEAVRVVVYRPPQPVSGVNPIFDVVSRDGVGIGGGSGGPPDGDEDLVFENDGEQRIDLGGCVYNEAGQSYQFPDGTTLAPGDQVTLHSEPGRNREDHRRRDADTAVWSDRRDTVTVETVFAERSWKSPTRSENRGLPVARRGTVVSRFGRGK